MENTVGWIFLTLLGTLFLCFIFSVRSSIKKVKEREREINEEWFGGEAQDSKGKWKV